MLLLFDLEPIKLLVVKWRESGVWYEIQDVVDQPNLVQLDTVVQFELARVKSAIVNTFKTFLIVLFKF